jgi:hypothetical protein
MSKRFLLFLFVATTIFSSCVQSRYIYSAAPPNNPFFKEKNDSKLAAYYSEATGMNLYNKYAHGLDVQGAYAITDHFAVTAGLLNRREKDELNYGNLFDSSVVTYKRNLVDFGGGYFVALNKKKTITFNLYTGFSTGKFSFDDFGLKDHQNYSRYHSSVISRFYFQPSINFYPGKVVQIALVLKSSYLKYKNIGTSYTIEELQSLRLYNLGNNTRNIFEWGWDFQLEHPKVPWVKLEVIASFVTRPVNSVWDVRTSNSSAGLNFDLSKIKKKDKQH